ncbi:unnamed protein product [Protopolystoma xenopodis]|uniref:Uncharacterized protein n=1 Tax=Protopolystoma xenopodis TaxID=117903 RepID=A0A448WYS2_9PLAT|nr:unnamed protein product [Protopolystoma xenopodis]
MRMCLEICHVRFRLVCPCPSHGNRAGHIVAICLRSSRPRKPAFWWVRCISEAAGGRGPGRNNSHDETTDGPWSVAGDDEKEAVYVSRIHVSSVTNEDVAQSEAGDAAKLAGRN